MRAHLSRIEWKIDKLAWHWTRHALSLPTSSPTAPIYPTATVTPTRSHTPPILKHGRRYIPKLLGWLAEKAIQYMGPTLFGFALSGWALVKHYGVEMWQWLLAFAHWLGM